jgi:DNA primase
MSISTERAVSQLVDRLGAYKRSGGNYLFHCPFCEEAGVGASTKEKLYVHPGKGVYNCFRCSEVDPQSKGPLAKLFKLLGLDYETGVQHVDNVLEHVSQPLFTWKTSGRVAAPIAKIENAFPIDPKTPSAYAALAYLDGRGFTWEMIEPYRLLYSIRGWYENRILIPCFENGEMVYFSGRTWLPDQENPYMNPSAKSVPLGRENVVFNIDSLVPGEPCIVVEGQLNAMMLGLRATACLGKAISETHIEKLLAKRCSEYICALDDDAWGLNVALAKALTSRTDAPVSLVKWPVGMDAVDLGRQDAMACVLDRREYSLGSLFEGDVITVFGGQHGQSRR